MFLHRREALELWRAVSTELVRSNEPDLTARQTAVMLTVYLTPPPHTVRGLSAHLKVKKPAITRALDTLEKYDLVRRKRDEEDLRSILVQRTVRGSVYLTEIGELFAGQARALPAAGRAAAE